MITKFTKGKWKADLESLASINCGEKHIAMVNYFNTHNKDNCVNEAECVANANLIAAAPDMYTEIQSDIEELEDKLLDVSKASGDYDFIVGRIKHKKSLLAKARGEI
tara:strand:- start:2890 stop:3210 length:321 start_codon:yes stop_codon:yes gene_type:complete